MSSHMEVENFTKGEDFRMASLEAKANNSSSLEKNYPKTSVECILSLAEEEDYRHLFFQCPFAHMMWATQGIA